MVRDVSLYVTVPSFFRCPISLDVMKSPVSLCTGVTYDRTSIQRWLDSGNNTCPATMQVLKSKELVPNRTLQRLIQIWSDSVQTQNGTRVESAANSAVTKEEAEALVKEMRAQKEKIDHLSKLICFAKESEENCEFLARFDGFVEMLVGFLDGDKDVNFLERVVRVFVMILNKVGDYKALRLLILKQNNDASHECLSSLLHVLRQGRSVNSRVGVIKIIEAITLDAESKQILSEKEGFLLELVKLTSLEKDPSLIEASLSCLAAISVSKRVKIKLINLKIIGELRKLLTEGQKASVSIIEKALKLLEMVASFREGRAEFCNDAACVEAVMNKVLKVSSQATEHAVMILWSACYLFRDRVAQDAVSSSPPFLSSCLLLKLCNNSFYFSSISFQVAMEVSMIGSSSQAKICTSRSVLSSYREIRFCNFQKRVSLLPNTKSTRWRNSGLSFTLNAVRSSPVRSDRLPHRGSSSKPKSLDGVRVFVGLPLDAVSDCNTVNHARAIAAGLRALKLLGIDGVELPVWWGIVEKESMGKYDWSGYLVLAEMIQNAGLKLHVSLCFHGSKQPKIPLPEWVSHIGDLEPSIYHADRSGDHYRECLSLAVDEVPVLNGKTPVQVYQEFCESFKSSFSNFFGSTITGVTVGLGPDGELRYPCHRHLASHTNIPGVGEFQCYDKNMLNLLKEKAEAAGNPLWGLAGPHDAPSYDQFPNSSQFFKDNGGSWDSPYGDFFLSWYSSELLSHGDRLLSLASTSFSNTPVTVHGKIPLMHSWYKTRAHPSELTAGFYNTASRDGYEAVAEMFARNSCKMILPGMDLSDKHQPQESLSSPESMLAQIRIVCRKHRVEISGQNSVVSKAPHGFEQIKKNISGASAVDLFTYQRMGADFFSPEHFPSFTHFVRNLNQLEMFSDDLPEEEEVVESVLLNSESNSRMQAA